MYKWLRIRRHELGLKAEDVGRELGLSADPIRRFERGDKISISLVPKYIRALRMDREQAKEFRQYARKKMNSVEFSGVDPRSLRVLNSYRDDISKATPEQILAFITLIKPSNKGPVE